VDLAIDFQHVGDDVYASIRETLEAHGYRQSEQHPHRFIRAVHDVNGVLVEVGVDFLAGEYGGAGGSHRTQTIQDVRARKARGCDLAFQDAPKVRVRARLPSGASDEVSVRVAGAVPFLVMKGEALYGRVKPKDAYDIYFVISEYAGGITALADVFRPALSNKLVVEGLGKIRAKFNSVDALGPAGVADFFEVDDPEERERVRRDAYERVRALLDALGVRPVV
jgi:hypothetical protein